MRIIAGTKKGRTINAPAGMNTRPTLDKVREAVFGSLQFEICGSRVLDLFAGSGAMGLEALSRGARAACFCEHSRQSLRVLRDNIERLGFSDGEATVFGCDFREALRSLVSHGGERFDMVFIDPPYEAGLYDEALGLLVQLRLLSDEAAITVEHSAKRTVAAPNGLHVERVKRYGETAVTIMRKDVSE